MSKAPKDKDQEKADQRRDELAKRVLNTPPKPKNLPNPKAGKVESDKTTKPPKAGLRKPS